MISSALYSCSFTIPTSLPVPFDWKLVWFCFIITIGFYLPLSLTHARQLSGIVYYAFSFWGRGSGFRSSSWWSTRLKRVFRHRSRPDFCIIPQLLNKRCSPRRELCPRENHANLRKRRGRRIPVCKCNEGERDTRSSGDRKTAGKTLTRAKLVIYITIVYGTVAAVRAGKRR